MRNAMRSVLVALLLAPAALQAQEARSFGMGGCGTSMDWGSASLLWNPALLFYGAGTKKVLATLGSSALDTSNDGGSALNYTGAEAAKSSSDPVLHSQVYRGLLTVQWQTYGIGVLHNQERFASSSQGSLHFLADRVQGPLAASYDLATYENDERIDDFCAAMGRSFPLGQATAAVGSTFKVHQGTRLRRTVMDGSFATGSPNTVDYERWSAGSGTGYSWNFGAFLKPTGGIQLGYVIENVSSNFKWRALHETLNLDPATGAETVASHEDVELESPRPRFVRAGITVSSPDKSTYLTAEMIRQSSKTAWRYGYERLWPAQHVALRAGTYRDEVSGRRIWGVGGGYMILGMDMGLGIQANHWPVVQDSSLFGASFSASMRL